MIALTRFGVSFGFACSISATVPATTGDAMLVPVRLRYGLVAVRHHTVEHVGRLGLSTTGCPETASDTMPVPVATTSGFAAKSTAVGPREL